MGDGSVRVLTRILRINRHLHTVLLDRNLLSLNNLEEIVDAMNEYVSCEGLIELVSTRTVYSRNSVIQYFPVPITDIILMKTTEKDRMEKLQQLISKVTRFGVNQPRANRIRSSARFDLYEKSTGQGQVPVGRCIDRDERC